MKSFGWLLVLAFVDLAVAGVMIGRGERGVALVFIVMASMIKVTSQHVPAGQVVFFRSFFAIPVIVVWLIWRYRHLLRGSGGVAAKRLRVLAEMKPSSGPMVRFATSSRISCSSIFRPPMTL